MASQPLRCEPRSQFLNDAFQQRLAHWNRARLAPAFPADDWQAQIADDLAMLRLEGGFVEELRAEIAEAEEFGDSGRAEQLRGELEFLVAQLAQRFGSRARTRSAAETARKAVTKVIRAQIGKLLDAHPPLGEHLRAAVRMGTFCTYEPGTPTIWEVSAVNRARPHS